MQARAMTVPLTTRTLRAPTRSTSRPMKGASAAPRIAPTVVAPAMAVRLQPNSADMGTTNMVSMDMAEAALENPMAPAAPATIQP